MAAAKFFTTPAAWRAWLAQHHATKAEILVGFWKTKTGKACITWSESVDEALCFGWIDGVRRGLDDDSYSVRFTPRRPTSIWSAINVAKIEALRAAGKMHPAGEAAFAKRTAARTAVYSFERTAAPELTADEAAQLRAHAKAHAWFESQPPWYRRTALHWVVSPKRPETRARRLATLVEDSARGERVKPLRAPKRR